MPQEQVFLSFHERDAVLMARVDADLQKRGIATFRPDRDVGAFEELEPTIRAQVATSTHFVAGVSPAYLADSACRTHLFLARANGVRVLPVLASEFPRSNSPLHWLLEAGGLHTYAVKGIEELDIGDLSDRYPAWGAGSYEGNFERLVDAVRPAARPTPIDDNLSYISYHTSDSAFTGRLARDLAAARALIWFDKFNIGIGTSWRSAMYEGMQRAKRLVVCLSPRGTESEHVNHEVLLAMERRLPILPLVPDTWSSPQALGELKQAVAASPEMAPLLKRRWLTTDNGYDAMFARLKDALSLHAGAEPRNGIFLSYRRTDSQAITGRIRERLVHEFGADDVFMDVGTIPPGVDFSAEYRNWIENRAAVMLVVIGKTWASVKRDTASEGLPRIRADGDHVRAEVATALNKAVRVVPILVDQASMPRAPELPDDLHDLSKLNGVAVRHDPDFRRDMDELITEIRKLGSHAR